MKLVRHRPAWILLLLGSGLVLGLAAGLRAEADATGGERTLVQFAPEPGALALAHDGIVAPLWVADDDWPGVRRAAGDLQADFARVTGAKPALSTGQPTASPAAILIGTVGHSALIDSLIKRGQLDVHGIAGQWESFLLQVVEAPAPGIARAVVIAGSDKRGTIYGIYELSQQIGVSPWYWWADVPAAHHDALYVRSGRFVVGPPVVRYRGIFLNDEAPALTNWVRAKFGNAPVSQDPPVPPGIANYGHEFYTRIFEVMLRLRANYLWPAMWDNAFNEDDPENARLADEYGIVMGTSHQEPMLRAQKEWDRRYQATLGHWNYAKQADVLEKFWREGVRRNRNYESIVTLGLRGADDTEMAPGGPEANRRLLEHIVDRQRDILREEVNPDLSRVPQMWCLYKEVMDYYEAGMRVPDDVTLLWAEDNWGNLRRLPTAAERNRPGGAGVYYHFDYHGGPRSYQWINTNPLPKIWEQMSLAHQYGADRIWIVNVGHFKGYELPLEFFLNLAWAPDRWNGENLGEFTRQWAARQFGPEHATEIAGIISACAKDNGRRKPELLAPDTYSLVNYGEAESVLHEVEANSARAEKIFQELPEGERNAFYQLVLFPAKASAVLKRLYHAAGLNVLYARQGRALADWQAEATRRFFREDLDLMAFYNGPFAEGRWSHFMDQTHLGYTGWRDPKANSLDAIKLVEPQVPEAAGLGVAVEGSEDAWPGANSDATLPSIDALNRQSRHLEVFDRGSRPLAFAIEADEPWIVLDRTSGETTRQQGVSVDVDWSQVPAGDATGTITVKGAGQEVRVKVRALNPIEVTRETLDGFSEAEDYVSIEPEHFTRRTEVGERSWKRIADYGRTLSGMRAEAPVDAAPAVPGVDSPCLEYKMYLFTTGPAEVTAITAPTLNFVPDRGLRYAVSFDDEAPQTVTLVPKGFRAQNGNVAWEESVVANAHFGRSKHTIARPGYHVLKLWMVDPAVVLQKLVVDLGGVRPSYLGPPESFRGPAKPAVALAPLPKPPWELSPDERQRQQKLIDEDHADMMRQLGIRKLRPGSNGNTAPGTPNQANYDEAKANPYPNWPELLVTKDGRKVTAPELWWQVRRPEIVEDFEREVYGRVPKDVPTVKWEVAEIRNATVAGHPVIARRVVGHVENSAYPSIPVDIRMSVVLPTEPKMEVPVLIMFGWGEMPGDPVPKFPGVPEPSAAPSPEQLIAAGWGYVSLNPASIQADNGAGLTAGIIGLTNHGQRRKPDDWGTLRAWAWGASRALDYLDTIQGVHWTFVGIEGVSRFGKAALVAMAFDERFAIALIGSSGEGGAKPHRRNFGEAVENLTSTYSYHWMAGNFLKYGAEESNFGARDANDLPVDAHELIALCAPRGVFISYGVPEKGDAQWLDQQGSYMATVAAGAVYRLLEAKDLGVEEDYRTAKMPPVNFGLLTGNLAWRQHDGGHEDRSNMKYFIQWTKGVRLPRL